MFFADDSYLYCQALEDEANRVMSLLCSFEIASGIVEVGENCLYLGLPNTMNRNKSVMLGFLKEKMRNQIKGWDGMFLSRTGKEVLLKMVVQSLPTYAMRVFLLPKKGPLASENPFVVSDHPSLANQKVFSLMKVGESSWDEECNGESSGVYSVESVY
uniref:Reverse transcriptase n=1 Tax=Cannabis sativa TaxID=3483 RepID=A0A803PCT2_CANSA